MSLATIGWLVILGVILVLEGITLGKRKDTLTEHVRWLRARFWGELIVIPLWAWLTYHWFVDAGYTVLYDIGVVLLGIFLAVVIQLLQEAAKNGK